MKDNNIPYPKKVLKPCPDTSCNLRFICKRPKSNSPYTNIWHGEDEETGIHFCNYIIHEEMTTPPLKSKCDGHKLSNCCNAPVDTDILICSECGEHCGTMCDDCEEEDCEERQTSDNQ